MNQTVKKELTPAQIQKNLKAVEMRRKLLPSTDWRWSRTSRVSVTGRMKP